MIYVDDLPFISAEPSAEGGEILASLLEHPTMIASSNLLKATPVKKVSFSEESPLAKCLYVFQREYAAVDPSLVEFVGTDEATTCVGLVIRNQNTKRTSICHMDFVDVVDMGLTQMLSFVVDVDVDANLDVHLIGSFDDGPHDLAKGGNGSGRYATSGYSLPLCSKIVAALQSRKERFQLKTLCVLSLNTKNDIAGNAIPIVSGFLVETYSGLVTPAYFDQTSRCPDEIVRRIRVITSYGDPYWTGRLLEIYDMLHDRIIVKPCSWGSDLGEIASSLQQLSDHEMLSRCSTSPAAESPDFVENQRRIWSYLIQYPDWRRTFRGGKSRIFERKSQGGWLRCKE